MRATVTDASYRNLNVYVIGDCVATQDPALRAKFVAYELPGDFVADLRSDRNAITNANRVNQGENQEGVESTTLIGELLGNVLKLLVGA